MTTQVRFGNTVVQMGIVPPNANAAPPIARAMIVGRTARGPINQPVIVKNVLDFETKFGIGTEANGGVDVYLAVKQYFKDAPSYDAVIVRLFDSATLAGGGISTEAGTAKVLSKATAPGTDYDALQVAYLTTSLGFDFFFRRMVNGRPSPTRSVRNIALSAEGILNANISLLGTGVQLVYNPNASTSFGAASTDESSLNWVPLAGGLDSPAITAIELAGEIDPETRVRTGLHTLDSSEYGGGVVIAPGMNTDAHRQALLAFAQHTARFAPIEPAGDVYPSAAVNDKVRVESFEGATFGAYYYGRGRTDKTIFGRPVSALGHIAALYVNSAMRQRGYIAPPAGRIGLVDIQRGPDGRTPLVDDDNFTGLLNQGVNVLLLRDGNVEVQGLELLTPDPDQPATTKTYQRWILNALVYDIGPRLRRFDNAYVDARGAFESAVRERIREGVLPYWESDCLYGSTAHEAFNVSFNYERITAEGGRVQYRVIVNLTVKISPVAEGVTVNLYHIDINTPFSF